MSANTIAPASERLSLQVAGNVRAEAARAGFSQSALSRALGISQPQVHKRWHGILPWSLDELEEVADLLGMDVFALMSGTPARWVAPAGAAARSKGLEPPTFWLGAVPIADQRPLAGVVDLARWKLARIA